MLEFLSLKTIFLIFHLLGVVLGMGAAVMTDIMFMKSTRDKVIDEKEISFIALGSRTVWMGLILIILSGAVLFLLSPEEYLNSSKFLAKMLVVAVLTVNGIFFHFKHLPLLRSQVGQDLTTSVLFIKKSKGLFTSGAISSVSWISALVLGMLKNVPYDFKIILSIYFVVLLGAVLVSFLARKMFLKN